MKPLFLLFFFTISLIGLAQKIKVDEVDKFTKQRRVETSIASLRVGLSTGLSIYIRSVDSTYFLSLKGFGIGANVVGINDPAIFLLDNDSTITIYPTHIQSYEIETGTTLGSKNYYKHQYSASLNNIQQLAIHNITSIRKYGSDSYADIDIPEKNQGEFKKFAILFLNSIRKN